LSDLRPNVASSQFDWNVSHGTLSLGLDGDFSYTPDKNFVGTDSFTYVAFGGALNSNVATVTINVMDQAPFANAASY
jgi:VCBS repeat-containing protein